MHSILTELPANSTRNFYVTCANDAYFALHCSSFGELTSNVAIDKFDANFMEILCKKFKKSSSAQNSDLFESNLAIAIYVISLMLIVAIFVCILVYCRRRYKRKLFKMMVRNEIQMYTRRNCNFYGQNVIYPVQPYDLREQPLTSVSATFHAPDRVRVLSTLADNLHYSSVSFKDDIYDDVVHD